MERPASFDSKPPVCELRIQRLPHGQDMDLPAQASSGSAGFDLRAAVREPVILAPGERTLVPTGLVMAIPAGFEGQVRPRSGLALRHGVTLLNSPGTIDSDYRGEVGVILINHGQESFHIERGDRIAQLVVARAALLHVSESGELTEIAETNERGTGGFGSTGRK